jgi:excisionase family DNA binding protein
MSKKPISPEDWLTPQEAAPIMRCSVDYVWQLCREGKLKHRRKGRNILIKREHVTEYMDGGVE